MPVPADEAKLGDGYVVTHDKRAGKLVLTAVADATPVSRVVGDLPDTGVSQRDVRWTGDQSGPNAAYVDDQKQIHLVPSGVAQQPLQLLAPARNAPSITPHVVDTTADTLTRVLLSKPASGWRLTVRSKTTGKVVDSADSTAVARGELNVPWFGMNRAVPGDVPLPNGTYEWTLSVTPADASARPFHQGTGKGTFPGKASGDGWATKAVAVPFGDLDKDRCNDVLVRMADGSLRGYKVPCEYYLGSGLPYTKLGTGWNAYDVLTSPGDLTGDAGQRQPEGALEGLLRLGRLVQRHRRHRRHHRRRQERPGRTGHGRQPVPQRRRRQGRVRGQCEDRHRLAGLQGHFLVL
ncbi:hypothetical protein [Streptomyces diastatochromogenes]|uniref:hypothetical protein n=1 Tax=Streptomyces diastatochromogenes TaxID=42236 RepID=UPI003695390C